MQPSKKNLQNEPKEDKIWVWARTLPTRSVAKTSEFKNNERHVCDLNDDEVDAARRLGMTRNEATKQVHRRKRWVKQTIACIVFVETTLYFFDNLLPRFYGFIWHLYFIKRKKSTLIHFNHRLSFSNLYFNKLHWLDSHFMIWIKLQIGLKLSPPKHRWRWS